MELVKEIITRNYSSGFAEGTDIDNHKEYTKLHKRGETSKYDSDSNHANGDATEDMACTN